MMANASEYEAKRLRRIAENRQKLQELNISTLTTNCLSSMTKQKKRKREAAGESMEPTKGKSLRQRKKQKVDKRQLKKEAENTRRKSEEVAGSRREKIGDIEKREKQKALRLKEKLKLKKIKLKERKLRKKQKEKEKLERIVQKELELQRRMEEGEFMREEDRLARQVAKEMVKDEKNKKRQERKAMVNELVEEIVTEEQKLARQKEDKLKKVIYPVQKIDLPLVHISDPIGSYKTKPVLLSPFLNVDVNFFHAFSLGKQFLPPGKKSVMQGLCPGGFTTTFQDHVDIHVWKNAMTLFVSGTTGMFYEYMFEKATHHGKKHVFFRWTRTQAVTPHIMWRMRQVQKGDEFFHVNNSYYDVPIPTQKPEPLLFFVQYPKGPYIYCGRLGYLGHQAKPLELSFQLLDIHALNWRRIHTMLTSC
ncbi:unnamed protein product [Peronospora destructor]|uniref:Uncharacterized protein n=1 Tax=Peronospora destructor TaxID=86335 RepID=A0AAV0TEV3_9STRA|nr:unnamed protein product [Peronospora destructor]